MPTRNTTLVVVRNRLAADKWAKLQRLERQERWGMVMRFKKEATTWALLRAARAGSSSSSRSKPTTHDTSKDSGE